MRSLAILALMGLLAAPAVAAGDRSFVSVAASKVTDDSKVDGIDGKFDVTILNLSAAFGVGSGVVLGAKYFDYQVNGDVGQGDGTTISGYGPMAGYLHDGTGLFVNAAYLLFPTKAGSDQNGDKATFSGGNGYVIDVGKMFEVGKQFGVAVQLSQSNVTYKKLTDADGKTADLSGVWSDASLYPYISAMVFF
jgi:hypothetical protein